MPDNAPVVAQKVAPVVAPAAAVADEESAAKKHAKKYWMGYTLAASVIGAGFLVAFPPAILATLMVGFAAVMPALGVVALPLAITLVALAAAAAFFAVGVLVGKTVGFIASKVGKSADASPTAGEVPTATKEQSSTAKVLNASPQKENGAVETLTADSQDTASPQGTAQAMAQHGMHAIKQMLPQQAQTIGQTHQTTPTMQ